MRVEIPDEGYQDLLYDILAAEGLRGVSPVEWVQGMILGRALGSGHPELVAKAQEIFRHESDEIREACTVR